MTTIVDDIKWDNVQEGKGGVLVDRGNLSTIRYRRLLFLTVDMKKSSWAVNGKRGSELIKLRDMNRKKGSS